MWTEWMGDLKCFRRYFIENNLLTFWTIFKSNKTSKIQVNDIIEYATKV